MDFYFDIADRLEALDAEFIVTVRPKGYDGCITLSNVQDEQVAGYMRRNIEEMLGDRFNDDEDESDGQSQP
jgi:hypothetical protein